jgi:glycine betaine transporter
LISVIAALVILCLPLRKQRLGNENPAYSFSWVALLYSTGMGSGLLLRAVQEPTYY